MALVIVTGALGVIIITGGLYLRSLLGELVELRNQLAECRRQITGIDRQMRAQRAHVTFLRQLLTEDEEGDPHEQAAVVNGSLHPSATHPPSHPKPVRRKRHLGLYLGGAVAALGTAARVGLREHRSHLISAVTGAAVTATTVTAVAIQPWSAKSSSPPSVPAVSAPSTHLVPSTLLPQPRRAAPASVGGPPPARPPATVSPAATLSTATVAPTGSPGFVPASEESPGAETSLLPPTGETPTHGSDAGTQSASPASDGPTMGIVPSTLPSVVSLPPTDVPAYSAQVLSTTEWMLSTGLILLGT